MEVGRTSPYRRHLSSCSTNESSDCSSKSISLDLVEGSAVRITHPKYINIHYNSIYAPSIISVQFLLLATAEQPSRSKSSRKHSTRLYLDETPNNFSSILRLAGILSTLVDCTNAFIRISARSNNARHRSGEWID